jgi:transposase InsO family protein
MKSITQDMLYRQSLLNYAKKHGVTKAAIKYKTNRQYIYRWLKRYDGTLESLRCRSRRPHHHPKEHTAEEIALIQQVKEEHSLDGLVVLWVRLRQCGYKRSITGLYRLLRRLNMSGREKTQNPKYVPKPYQAASFPGEKVQVDVKVVPTACITGQAKECGEKMYQYTAIDECTRLRCLAAYPEQSTYSSMLFLQKMKDFFPFEIKKVQTDNGTEFTKSFTGAKEGDKTLFEQQLDTYHIAHQKIRPYTPRHNGKVERSHRKDNEQFYATHHFDSLGDFERQLAIREQEYNNFPMRPLGWKSPVDFLQNFGFTL